MRILVISNYRSPLYSVRPEAEIFIGLKKLGVEVDIMSFSEAEYKHRFVEHGIRYIDHHPSKKWDPETIKLIRQLNNERQYDLVHVFNNKAITCAIKALRWSKTKLVTYRGVTGYSHWYDPTSYITHLHPRVDAITCVAEAASVHLRKQLLNKKKVYTVYKGHDPDWYANVELADMSKYKLNADLPIGICVANVRKMKGIKYLLEATNLLQPDEYFNLLLVGDGMQAPEFQTLIQKSKMRSMIQILGFSKNVLGLIKASDFLLLPSIKGEGLPKAVIEAMVQGVMPIATNVGGGPELIEHLQSGMIALKKSPVKLAEAISFAVQNEDKVKQMGQAAKLRIAEHFALDSSVKRMMEVYHSILN